MSKEAKRPVPWSVSSRARGVTIEITPEQGRRALADSRAACARANLAKERMLVAKRALEQARARLSSQRLGVPSEEPPEST